MFRSFPFLKKNSPFFPFYFAPYKKELSVLSILFKRLEKNVWNGTFFSKEQKERVVCFKPEKNRKFFSVCFVKVINSLKKLFSTAKKSVSFFSKEQKNTAGMEHSFQRN